MTVIASGILCGILALVVLFTDRRAFFSPLAIIVVAAIGSAAVLLQVRFHNAQGDRPLHPPVWLNLIGIGFAVAAFFADWLKMSAAASRVCALVAVASFGISSAIVLQTFRKPRDSNPKTDSRQTGK